LSSSHKIKKDHFFFDESRTRKSASRSIAGAKGKKPLDARDHGGSTSERRDDRSKLKEAKCAPRWARRQREKGLKSEEKVVETLMSAEFKKPNASV